MHTHRYSKVTPTCYIHMKVVSRGDTRRTLPIYNSIIISSGSVLPSFPIHPNPLHCSIAPCATVRMRANARGRKVQKHQPCVTLGPKGNFILSYTFPVVLCRDSTPYTLSSGLSRGDTIFPRVQGSTLKLHVPDNHNTVSRSHHQFE